MAGKQEDKAAAKEAARAKRAESRARRSQIFEAFKMQRREDKALVPLMVAVLVGVAAVAFLIGLIWDMQWLFLGPGVVLGALAAVLLFGRRVSRNVYSKAEGQRGAAAWALDSLRGNWRVTQAVAGTTQFDAIHRVLGLPGVVLIGEGAPHRVKELLAQEKKRLARVVGSTPIYDFIVGTGEGEVPLRKLQRHMTGLPRNITKADVDRLEKSMAALATRGASLPKGPLPAGAKMRNVQRAMRRR